MPAIGSIPPVIRKSGSSDIDSRGKWVGSKLATKFDLLTIDANGRYDQVVAAGNAITSASSRIACCMKKMAASVLVDVGFIAVEKFDDDTLISLPAANGAGAAVATTAAMKGKQFPLFRDASGNYTVNTTTNVAPVVEVVELDPRYAVGESGGPLVCRVLPGMRLA